MNACLTEGSLQRVELDNASKLAEASAFFRNQDYELVIADLNLPDTEGLETFFKVKELAKDAAIVVMTGMDDFDLAARAVRAGAQDYLVKGDLPPQRVCQSVSKALERQVHLKSLSSEAVDLRKKNSSLRELVQIDPLTGMFNRRGFQRALARPGQVAQLFHSACAMQIGLDDFKTVNDLYGYSSGNEALKEIGHRIRKQLRAGDIAARIGGDEFLVFMPGTHLGAARELGERVRRAVVGASLPGDFKVTASVGVSTLPKRPCTIDEILELTHRVLRMSKGAGKNRVVLSGGMPGADFGPDGLEGAGPVRSPFFCLQTGRLAGYGFEFPDWMAGADPADPAALPEDRQVLELVHSALKRGEGLECHLHLSHTQLLQLRPEQLPKPALTADGLHRLRLAIPDIPMNPIPPGLLDAVHRLQSAGWAFALNGLDLGPHSWASLIMLEPAVVTLKPDLVTGAWADHRRLRGLVRLSRAVTSLGAYMVAGGVETSEDLKVMKVLGVPYGWGSLMLGDRP